MKFAAVILAALKGLGIDIPAEKTADVEKAFGDIELPQNQPAPSPVPSQVPSPAPSPAPSTVPKGDGSLDPTIIRQIVAEAQAPLLAQIDELKKGYGTHEEHVKAEKERLATQRTQQIKERLDAAISEGRIPQEKRDEYQKHLEKDFELASTLISQMPANPAVNRSKDGRAANGQGQPREGDGTFANRSAQSRLERAADPTMLKYINEQLAETNANGGSPNDTPPPSPAQK